MTLFGASVPGRRALDYGPRLRLTIARRVVQLVHADGHDLGGAFGTPARARLPGLDLLGVPQADRNAAPSAGPRSVSERTRSRRLRAQRGGSLSAFGALPRLSPTARRTLAICAVLSGLSAAALVLQAWALASAVASVVSGVEAPIGGWLVLLVGAVAARSLLCWTTQVLAARAAAGAKEELRAALLDRSLALGPEWIASRGPAELTVLATKGLDALDAYFTVYLPAVVTSLVVPLGVGAAILFADWPSAVLVAITMPLIPLFAALVGMHTRARVGQAADATARLSRHLLELVRALPVLTAFRRAEAQVSAVRRVSDAHRKATLATLRTAFLSAFVLELVATLSVALVAVGIGLRLVSGELGLATGLMVLILAPECYLPLRAAGAAHHASEDGVEAVRRVAAVLDAEVPPPGIGFSAGRPGHRREPAGAAPRRLRPRRRLLHRPTWRRGPARLAERLREVEHARGVARVRAARLGAGPGRRHRPR